MAEPKHIQNGDVLLFSSGNMEGLRGFVTHVFEDKNQDTYVVYKVVGDGRLPHLKKNTVYQWCTLAKDDIIVSAQVLPMASREEHLA